jgi:putative flippase GtrA
MLNNIQTYYSKLNPKIREFARFCIVGCISMGLHYVIYLMLLLIMGMELTAGRGTDWRATMAYTIGYVVSFVVNMWLTARFTFKEKLNVKRGGGFILSHAINYVIEVGLLNLFLYLHLAEWLSPLLALLIAVPINFIMVRTVFKRL